MIQDIHPHKFNNSFVAVSEIQDDDYIFLFRGKSVLLMQTKQTYAFPRKKDIPNLSAKAVYLFALNDVYCFLVLEAIETSNSNLAYYEINSDLTKSLKEIDYLSSVAFHIKNWYEQHKFCGKCGAPTQLKKDERAISCPSCKLTLYPNIAPAIIVAILWEDKILLAHGANFRDNFYSLVAGYVDIGESIECAVTREVKEEVGLNIKNIRYYKSQPWPFSGSLMIGFIAEVDGSPTINIDNKEILHAEWYSKTNLPNHPNKRSIAGEIIEKFMQSKL